MYGIWLYKDQFEIFGEHIDQIDKFKPSRTYLSSGTNIKEFISKVKEIQQHPILYLVDSLTTGDALIPYQKKEYDGEVWCVGYQVKRGYNDETKCWDIYHRDETMTQDKFVLQRYEKYLNDKKEEKEKDWADKNYAFHFFKELPYAFKEIQAVGIIDENKKTFYSSPRYTIRVLVDPTLSYERITKLFEEINQLTWNKNYSDEMKTYDHQFSFYGIFDSKKDMKVCDYQFWCKNENK